MPSNSGLKSSTGFSGFTPLSVFCFVFVLSLFCFFGRFQFFHFCSHFFVRFGFLFSVFSVFWFSCDFLLGLPSPSFVNNKNAATTAAAIFQTSLLIATQETGSDSEMT